jgi:hypothetical protein
MIVANDVETEQILHDRCARHTSHGHFTSHVQLRASIPLFWTQESNPMIAQPAIVGMLHSISLICSLTIM